MIEISIFDRGGLKFSYENVSIRICEIYFLKNKKKLAKYKKIISSR